jgi:hypothetical protein
MSHDSDLKELRTDTHRQPSHGAKLFLHLHAAIRHSPFAIQNSRVLDNVTCRESPIDTKNRLAAEV